MAYLRCDSRKRGALTDGTSAAGLWGRGWDELLEKDTSGRLRQLMEAVHTETHLTTRAEWPALLEKLLTDKQLPSLLVSPQTAHGKQLSDYLANREGTPELKAYDRPVEEWKAELFNDTPASLTGTH